MTLRRPFRPLRPDLDKFLYATIGDEPDGVPLSVLSALVRLGLDPWKEASRLSSLSTREAAEQLARLIAELPGVCRPQGEVRELAGGLAGLLPKHDPGRSTVPQLQLQLQYRARMLPNASELWIACIVLAAAVLISAVVHGGLPFGIGSP